MGKSGYKWLILYISCDEYAACPGANFAWLLRNWQTYWLIFYMHFCFWIVHDKIVLHSYFIASFIECTFSCSLSGETQCRILWIEMTGQNIWPRVQDIFIHLTKLFCFDRNLKPQYTYWRAPEMWSYTGALWALV